MVLGLLYLPQYEQWQYWAAALLELCRQRRVTLFLICSFYIGRLHQGVLSNLALFHDVITPFFFIKSHFKHTRKSFSVLTSFCFAWPCDLSFTAPTLYFSAFWFFPLTREQNMLTKIRNNCKSVSFTADTVKASCFQFVWFFFSLLLCSQCKKSM